VAEIIATLPQQVYLSFDIDGLNPSLCPNTGTPVPGGMELEEVVYLIDAVKASGRTLIGMDLVEVSPGEDEWDANVGARALYTLSNRLS
jgi:agmatinase